MKCQPFVEPSPWRRNGVEVHKLKAELPQSIFPVWATSGRKTLVKRPLVLQVPTFLAHQMQQDLKPQLNHHWARGEDGTRVHLQVQAPATQPGKDGALGVTTQKHKQDQTREREMHYGLTPWRRTPAGPADRLWN